MTMEEFCTYHDTYSQEQKKLIAKEFNRLEGQYYLEHVGATLYSEKQLEEIASQLCKNLYANPHARNLSSKLSEDAVDIVRFEILAHFKTCPQEYSVIFTSGATAALKLVAESFAYENGRLVYLQDNHTSVLGMRGLAKESRCLEVDDAFGIFSKNCGDIRGDECPNCNSLFVYPAQSNFSGFKYPLSWIDKAKKGALNESNCHKWFVALDAASYVSTNELDLSAVKPDFVAISFYKIFGYPTGLGALLVKNSSSYIMKKKYFGGGTVFMAQTLENTVIFRDVIHEKFEDGTIPFLSILALREGFNTLKRLSLTFDLISRHTFSLAQYVFRNLLCLHHSNGRPVAILYHDTKFEDLNNQGAIINFNLLRDNGEYIGYSEVLHFSNLYHIHLRTGCFCNPGACQYFLKLSPDDIKRHFDAGHVCGDQHDLVNGYPTGSVRISFGYMSTKADADRFLEMVEKCFITKPTIKKLPQYFKEDKRSCDVEDEIISRQPDDFRNHETGVLQQLILYPIKSCGGFSVLKWPITSTGLKYDRQWMVVNSSGVCVTQKHNKKMCLVRPFIDLETDSLIMDYPGQKPIRVPINLGLYHQNPASLCQSKVCGDKIQGWDCGDQISEWLSEVLDCPGLRLLKQCSENERSSSRTTKKNEQLQLSLANKAQYLLINTASVSWLRQQIKDEEFCEILDVTVQRFRPNFVIKFHNPFVENNFSEFVFDNLKFQTAGVCTRCQMICIDQTTARASKEPLQTLSKVFKGKISFGVYLNRSLNEDNQYLQVGCDVTGKRKHFDT